MRHIHLDRADSEAIKGRNAGLYDPLGMFERKEIEVPPSGILDIVMAARISKVKNILANCTETRFDNFLAENSRLLISVKETKGTKVEKDMQAREFVIITKTENRPNPTKSSSSILEMVKIRYYIYKDDKGSVFYLVNPIYEGRDTQMIKNIDELVELNNTLAEHLVKSGLTPLKDEILTRGLNKELSHLISERVTSDISGLELGTIDIAR